MAHQWYGDEITPEDWRDLWMNEGMAMYLQGIWQAEQDGRTADEVMDEYASFEMLMREASGPPGDYDPTQFGEGNVYYGPALMWHELRKQVGDELFFQVVRDWPALDPDTNADREEYLRLAGRADRRRPRLLRRLAAQPDHPRALVTGRRSAVR